MMQRSLKTAVAMFAATATGLVAAGPALAVNPDILITLGTPYDGASVNQNDKFLVDFAANRSYVCEGVPSASDTEFDFNTTVEQLDGSGNPVGAGITARAIGTIPPPITGEVGGSADNRVALTPTVTARYRLTVATARAGGEPVQIRCYATTVFGEFNTTVSNFNFLQLSNKGNADCTATIALVDNNGAAITLTSPTVTVPAQQRRDVDLHTPAGTNKFGTVRITHDCPFKTLDGTVSQYVGTVSSFSLAAAIPLTSFEQKP